MPMSDDSRKAPAVSTDRAAAERRARRIRAFRAELEALVAERVVVLSAEQRGAIDAHHHRLLQQLAAEHDIDRTERAGQLSRGMRIASFFAALALTAAVYSLVGRFWGSLDVPLQATLLCAFPLMALVGVELAARRERTLYVASIFATVAFGTYWLAVVELSAVLGVPITSLPLWGGAFFAITLSMPYGFRFILGGGLMALLLAIAGSVFQSAGMPWTHAIEFPEILMIAAFALGAMARSLAPINLSFVPVTRSVGFGAGLLGLLILSTSGRLSLLPASATATEIIYQVAMLIVCVGLLIHAVRRRWTEIVYLAAGALTVFLLLRFVDWFWDAIPRFVFFLALALVAFGWLLVLRRVRHRLAVEDAL
jgi:hypothetical protein